VLLVLARVEGTVGSDPVDRQKRPVQDQVRLRRRGLYCLGECGGGVGKELNGLGDVSVDGGGADPETGRELGVGLAVAEVGEGEQSLLARAQTPSLGAESAPMFLQTGREEQEGRAGHVDAGCVDKHVKPLVETDLLVVNPIYQGLHPSDRPTAEPTPEVGKGSLQQQKGDHQHPAHDSASRKSLLHRTGAQGR
jgi:hypothetical protein